MHSGVYFDKRFPKIYTFIYDNENNLYILARKIFEKFVAHFHIILRKCSLKKLKSLDKQKKLIIVFFPI